MPANLTPQYQKAEQEFRKAHSAQEKMEHLEHMLKLIPKHKGTEKLQADLKSRLKELKSEVESEKKSTRKGGASYKFPAQGAGQVLLIGAPNSGKSRILAELTNATPEIGDYPFTTHEPMPGMMPWEDVMVQLIDTPPVTESHIESYLINLVRSADALVLCFDGSSDDAPEETAAVIEQFESRKTILTDHTGFDEADFSRVNLNTLLVTTRGWDPDAQERVGFFREITGRQFNERFVDLDQHEEREVLREALYQALHVKRVYTKRPGKPAEYIDPFTIDRAGTVEDLAVCVHREMAEKLKYAKVWGESAHDGQSVSRDHVLCDRDMVELHW